MAVDSESNLDKKFIQTMKLLNIYLNHFPSHEKHGLALKIRQTAYDMYDYIVEAQKRYRKKTTLTNLDIKHEQLRMQVRLAFELSYFGHPKTHSLQHLLNYAEQQNYGLYCELPKIYHTRHHQAAKRPRGINGVMHNRWGDLC